MSRRPDPPELQAAKGDPGRRKSKRLQAAVDRQAAIDALAAQPVGTSVEPPAALRDNRYAAALAVWREIGPELERTSRLQPIHRTAFAMFCIYIAEWWSANADLAQNGRSQNVKTIAGGSMERERPAVKWRAEAFANAMEAAKQFGLTPREEYSLFKDQSTVSRENPGLFSRGGPQSGAISADSAVDPAPAPAVSIGAMARAKSAPPPRPH